jgi:hypothetical protein
MHSTSRNPVQIYWSPINLFPVKSSALQIISQHLVIVDEKLFQSLFNDICAHKYIHAENILYNRDLCIRKLIDIYSLVITDSSDLKDVNSQLSAYNSSAYKMKNLVFMHLKLQWEM